MGFISNAVNHAVEVWLIVGLIHTIGVVPLLALVVASSANNGLFVLPVDTKSFIHGAEVQKSIYCHGAAPILNHLSAHVLPLAVLMCNILLDRNISHLS